MGIPECPPRFRSKGLRTRWNRIIEALRRHDLDPESRAELVADYVEMDRRITELRRDSRGGSIATRLSVQRALSVAMSERRRLHQRLFAGGTRLDEALPTVAAAAAAAPVVDADEAWRDHYHGARLGKRPHLVNDGTPEMTAAIAAYEREGKDLEARFGRPSWNALLYATAEEQIKGERAIEAYNSRHSKKRKRVQVDEEVEA